MKQCDIFYVAKITIFICEDSTEQDRVTIVYDFVM